MEGDDWTEVFGPILGISTHALTWRATSAAKVNGEMVGTFLPTPSHGGRRRHRRCLKSGRRISTHALTWRATVATVDFSGDFEISTHALTWRATGQLTWRATGQAGSILDVYGGISTHALTWRATCSRPG